MRQEVALAGCATPPPAGPPGAASVEIVESSPARVRLVAVTDALGIPRIKEDYDTW